VAAGSQSAPVPEAAAVAELRRRLERAVRRVCPRWLVAQVDDIVQVAVIRVLDRQKTGEVPEAVSTSYLGKVAYTVMVDEIRKLRARREDEVPEDLGDPAPDPAAAARGAEIGAGILDCLARMVRDRRLAVTLYLQGHSVPEAARVLGWEVKRVENLVYRGLADLRGCLLDKGMAP
jgi:RNA polymerase sigma-70 factor (ECF subfamily)